MDGTFRIVKKTGFMQLLVLHVIVGTPLSYKAVPTMYIFMSKRTKLCYMEVIKTILNIIMNVKKLAPYVSKIMIDFEIALWEALRQLNNERVLNNVKIAGCLFHYTQALFRKLTFYKLKPSYIHNSDTRLLLREFMALALLPHFMITKQFLRLRRICFASEGKIGECLQDFSTYFMNTWIKGRWKPTDWGQFDQLQRTNNIAESHNSKFKQKLCYGDMTFYSVIDKLFKVSANINVMLTSIFSYEPRVVPQNVLRAESFLMFLWNKLTNKQINPVVFLQSITQLKILDTNEKAAFEDIDSDDDAFYIE